jgi:uncharacterized integral membrane protein (TIGR00698 family)
MLRAFTQHPETVGESYFEHLASAWGFAATMFIGATACLLHGVFPFAFQKSGSRRIMALHERMVTHRKVERAPAKAEAETKSASGLLPGLAVAVALAALATWAAKVLHGPVAPLALIAGFVVAAPLGRRFDLAAGLQIAERPLLRAGVALLGLRIALPDVAALGLHTILLVLGCVALTLSLGALIGRAFGLDRSFSVLAASATAICGASAAVAVSQVLPKTETSERETGYVVAVVATLSTLAMLVYPWIAHSAGLPAQAVAVFLGASIHDVAQVAGAGYAVSPHVGDLAVTVKLLRVSLLALVVAAVAFAFARTALKAGAGTGARLSRAAVLPGFVVVFFALAAFRSAGLAPEAAVPAATWASNFLIGLGVVAIGAKTSIAGLKSMGWRPLAALVCMTALLCGLAFGAAQLA